MTEKVQMNREMTLRLALEYVTHDRNKDNGDPEDNFGAIAELWTFWLERKYGIKLKLSPTDVAMMSLMIKIARLIVTETKHDNWIDIAGYAACGAETAAIEHGLLKEAEQTESQPKLPIEMPAAETDISAIVGKIFEEASL